MIIGFVTALIVAVVVLGVALAKISDDRDEWQQRSQTYHIEAQEARRVAITSRAALAKAERDTEDARIEHAAAQAKAERDTEDARIEHAAAQAKITSIRKTITAAATDTKAIADLWNDES